MTSHERRSIPLSESGNSKPRLEAVRPKEQQEILSEFTEDQQQEIEEKRRVLASLAYFIGKDFEIPVELNEPGHGWHWDFEANKIRVDPKDLLEKPMDYLRFVIAHEGGHRRVSRTEFIPKEEWQQPGFSFMTNAIEDPRMNNFVAEAYPLYQQHMNFAYDHDLAAEQMAKERAQDKLGFQPRFMQAGFEYIKQWLRERSEQAVEISEDLPEEVRQVVTATLEAARDSWWRYPSRTEADASEENIRNYAKVSYEINRDKIWPEFQKLIEHDQQDEMLQQAMQDIQSSSPDGGKQVAIPSELQPALSEKMQQELIEGLQQSLDQGKPMPLDNVSDELKKKIREYVESLPESARRELADKAAAALHEFEKDIGGPLEGRLSENPDRRSLAPALPPAAPSAEPAPMLTPQQQEAVAKYRDIIQTELAKDENLYEQYRREVLPIIDRLEGDLREIFVARRTHQWKSGYKTGKRINIKRRLQEKAKGVPAVESKAWQRREHPQEKDYALSLLVDLSGSMQRDEKIEETFKAVIVLAEVLNRLSVKTEVLGFNDRLYEYQPFGEQISDQVRERMGGMLQEVRNYGPSGRERAKYNDDGWAVEQTSLRLAKQPEAEKFLIVLSDGQPAESPAHPQAQYDLEQVVNNIINRTNQKLIGLGVGRDTQHVESYYPNSVANVNVEQMADKLAELIKEAIAHYEQF